MNKVPGSAVDDDLELSLETLDQWETELDRFAAGIMQRLGDLKGSQIDTTGLIPQGRVQDVNHADTANLAAHNDNPEAMQLLQSLRELTQ